MTASPPVSPTASATAALASVSLEAASVSPMPSHNGMHNGATHNGLACSGKSSTVSALNGANDTSLVRFLVVDGFPTEVRRFPDPKRPHASAAGLQYERFLERQMPSLLQVSCEFVYPAEEDFEAPSDDQLVQYHAVAWTGSSLTIHEADKDPRVARQIELARKFYAYGIPQFGSCWGVQIAATAAGGICAKNLRGREFGLARKITLTPEGRAHPMFEGKPSVYDALCVHNDEVVKVPETAVLLASNGISSVQALAVRYLKGEFWAVQYHPEYDLQEIVDIISKHRDALIKQGFFHDEASADAYKQDVQTLHNDPQGRQDIAWKYGFDAQVMDPILRECEVRNFIKHLVLPYRRMKLADLLEGTQRLRGFVDMSSF